MKRHFLNTFRAFGYRQFRLVWIGAFASTTGTWMQIVAQSWVVLSMTGSALYLGVDAFLATAPMILFSLFGGALADRIDRRKLLLLSQYLQMTFALLLTVLILTEVVEVWHILALSFLTGTVQAIGGPAYQALLPLLVERDDVPNAIALNSMQFNLARMLGPVLAGIALASLGAAACFGLNALSFLAVIVMLSIIRTPFSPPARGQTSMLSDIREGFRFLGERKEIFHLSLIAFVAAFFGIPMVTLLPVVARDVFQTGATGYSMLMAISGAGSVCGALLLASVGNTARKGLLTLRLMLAFAILLIAFSLSSNYWVSAGISFLTGATFLGVIAMTSSLVQLATIETMRGRVMSIFMLAFRGGMPLGNLLSGWTADRFSVRTALLVDGIGLAVFVVLFLVPRSRVRDL